MPVTGQWLPVEDAFELQLIERLVRDGRTFVKGLRYHLSVGQMLASAILTDAGESPVALCIAPRGADEEQMAAALKDFARVNGSPAWVWRVGQGAIPALPHKGRPMAIAEHAS